MALSHAFFTDPESFELVKTFNHKPQDFDFDRLLAKLGFK